MSSKRVIVVLGGVAVAVVSAIVIWLAHDHVLPMPGEMQRRDTSTVQQLVRLKLSGASAPNRVQRHPVRTVSAAVVPKGGWPLIATPPLSLL